MSTNHLKAQLVFEIRGTHSRSTLLDFSRLLYHLDLSYEIARLATDLRYRKFRFPAHTFRRVISPLADGDQLILHRVSQQSPWTLHISIQDAIAAMTGGLGAVWLFLQCLEKMSMYGLNRDKVRLEIEKARLDVEERRRQLQTPDLPLVAGRLNAPSKKHDQVRNAAVSALESADHVDDESPLIPPRESVRLFNRLRSRRALSLFESNSRVLEKLEYRVLDVEVKARDMHE